MERRGAGPELGGGAEEPGSDGGRVSEAHPSHKTVAVLTVFTTAVIGLHDTMTLAIRHGGGWDAVAAIWARTAVRAARCLMVREEYR